MRHVDERDACGGPAARIEALERGIGRLPPPWKRRHHAEPL
jgi:hypothetical protein